MKIESTTTVHPNDSRPIGPPGRCTYCREPIGSTHTSECVIPSRTVVVRATIEYVVSVPANWLRENIEFHRNDSSWCCGNMVNELTALKDGGDCLCSRVQFEYVREATEEEHADLPEIVRAEMERP